jgi:tetratricopeptide (TPR) repeat protein
VQQTPADVAAWVNLAATEAALGLHAQALQHLERALQLDAAQPAIHFNRGHVLMQMGDAAAALESFRRAGDLAPERPDPVCNQAAALNQLGRHDEALALMQGVVQRYPELAAGWNLLGMCQHRLGQDALALASYQRAACATLADAWSNAAQVLARLQRHAEAIEHAERAVQLDPRHAVAARTLGVVLAGAKRHAEARPWLAARSSSTRRTPSPRATCWRRTRPCATGTRWTPTWPPCARSGGRAGWKVEPWYLLACRSMAPSCAR